MTCPILRIDAAEEAGFFTVCDNSTDDWPVEAAADFLAEAT